MRAPASMVVPSTPMVIPAQAGIRRAAHRTAHGASL